MNGADEHSARRPILVELVGPPGAGKSTILAGLLARDAEIDPRPIPHRRWYVGRMGWHLLTVVTMALRHRMLSRSESGTLRALAYLRTLPRMLERWTGRRVVVFDQGPIFLLTRHDVLDESLAAWRAKTFDTWSALLDVIVVLDAPNAVLVNRINTRGKEHRVKGAPGDAALDFVARSRAVYDEALSRLGAHGSGPAILRFDTSVNSVAEIVDQIIAMLTDHQPDPGSGSISDDP